MRLHILLAAVLSVSLILHATDLDIKTCPNSGEDSPSECTAVMTHRMSLRKRSISKISYVNTEYDSEASSLENESFDDDDDSGYSPSESGSCSDDYSEDELTTPGVRIPAASDSETETEDEKTKHERLAWIRKQNIGRSHEQEASTAQHTETEYTSDSSNTDSEDDNARWKRVERMKNRYEYHVTPDTFERAEHLRRYWHRKLSTITSCCSPEKIQELYQDLMTEALAYGNSDTQGPPKPMTLEERLSRNARSTAGPKLFENPDLDDLAAQL